MRRVCSDMMIKEAYLVSPLARVVLDQETRLHRLILTSTFRDTIATFERKSQISRNGGCVQSDLLTVPDPFVKRLSDGLAKGSSPYLNANIVRHNASETTVVTRLAPFPREILAAPSEQLGQLSLNEA
jgi:hypothetical protein